MTDETEPAIEPPTTPPAKTAAKRSRKPRKSRQQATPGVTRNDSDVEMYYPTLGVTLKPGEMYKPKDEE